MKESIQTIFDERQEKTPVSEPERPAFEPEPAPTPEPEPAPESPPERVPESVPLTEEPLRTPFIEPPEPWPAPGVPPPSEDNQS